MTINEARDIIAAKVPKLSVCVSADAWYHSYFKIGLMPERSTTFRVSIHADKLFQVESGTLEGVLAKTNDWIAAHDKNATDQPLTGEHYVRDYRRRTD